MKNKRRKFIKSASLGSLGMMPIGNSLMDSFFIGKSNPLKPSNREKMLEFLDPESNTSYVPAGFFMHFNKQGDEAVKAHLDYYRGTQMDFVKIQFDGMSLPLMPEIKSPGDWAKMPIYGEDFFEPILYIIRNLVRELKREAIIIQTLYSPYQMAKQAVPWEQLVKHVYEDPEAVSRGMENVTLSILNFVQAGAKAGLDGFYTCAQGGETNRIADFELFNRTIKNFDMILYKAVNELVHHNILHICDYDGNYEGFTPRFKDYPGQIVNIPLQADGEAFSLSRASELFKRPVMGGMDRHGVIAQGPVDAVRREAESILSNAPKKTVLSANCTVSSTTPIANLRAAIEVAHNFNG
ncbi:MAG TPA: uroporphyrinogen decarboxylase family protein [Robiginitalea sp.]|nr:uroporphyrinogen decarboxylase family protein [Robiginitalea sp.]